MQVAINNVCLVLQPSPCSPQSVLMFPACEGIDCDRNQASTVYCGSDEPDVYLRERVSPETRKQISISFVLVEGGPDISHVVATITDNSALLMLTYHLVAMPSTDIANNITICILSL